MSQIPRRTTLSMTQPPKVRKTPTVSPTASQPMVTKRQQEPETPVKTIEVEAPIVIEDTDFGDSMENHNLIQVLSSVEEKNGLTPSKGNDTKAPAGEEEKTSTKESPAASPTTNGSGKQTKESSSKRSKGKRSFASDGVQDAVADETQSSSTSIRSSVDSSGPVEMESLLIPEDDDLVESPREKSVSYDSPRPNKTPGGTKVVRLAKGLRLSPFRRATETQQQQLDNVSTIVNLSTVSEQSMENNLDSPVVAKNGTPEAEEEDTSNNTDASGASSRRITARRTYATNRPLREMSFRNATREAYRKNGNGTPEENSNEAVNDSVNATVGSELGLDMDDLPETPAAGQKRRRESSDGEEDAAPQPKKSLFQTYCAIM